MSEASEAVGARTNKENSSVEMNAPDEPGTGENVNKDYSQQGRNLRDVDETQDWEVPSSHRQHQHEQPNKCDRRDEERAISATEGSSGKGADKEDSEPKLGPMELEKELSKKVPRRSTKEYMWLME